MKKYLNLFCALFLIIPFFIKAQDPLWSILIYTHRNNKDDFAELYEKLQAQIAMINAQNDIEIVYFTDDGELSTGFKKNFLLSESLGKYISFMSDGVQVSDTFIQLIYQVLQTNPDCVSVVSIFNQSSKNSKKFINSVNPLNKLANEAIAYKPLNELNPIKRSLIAQHTFSKVQTDDTFYWPQKVLQSPAIKIEAEVKMPSYFLKN